MLDTIFNRRSIRRYQDRPVEDDKLRSILRAAMYAPSAGDRRPWHFIVVKDRGMIEQFMQLQPYSKMLAQAPVLIVVCGDQGREIAPGYFMEDCAAAVQNLLLAAYELGLGACWLGIAPVRERMEPIGRLFGLPENIVAFCGVAVGYPDETRQVPERFEEGRIHQDRW